MVSTGLPRGRAVVVAALAVLAFAGSACSSGSDDGSSDEDASSVTATDDTAAPIDTAGATETVAPAGTTVTDDAGDDAGDGDGAAICGEISAAEVGAAVGAGDFDSADDSSVDADTTCLYFNSTGFYGVSISTEPADSYLSGEVDGLSLDDALSRLELALTLTMDDGATIVRVPVGDGEAVVATGTDSILGAPKGAGATVVDGRVIVIEADGAELSPDAAGFAPIVTNLLTLATASS